VILFEAGLAGTFEHEVGDDIDRLIVTQGLQQMGISLRQLLYQVRQVFG
jgi:hypothetical protein